MIADHIAVLGVGEGEAAVDLQALAGGVAAVGLDQRVVDALGWMTHASVVGSPLQVPTTWCGCRIEDVENLLTDLTRAPA